MSADIYLIDLPQQLLCSSCGYQVKHLNPPFEVGKHIVVACQSSKCKHLDVELSVPHSMVRCERVKLADNDANHQ